MTPHERTKAKQRAYAKAYLIFKYLGGHITVHANKRTKMIFFKVLILFRIKGKPNRFCKSFYALDDAKQWRDEKLQEIKELKQ